MVSAQGLAICVDSLQASQNKTIMIARAMQLFVALVHAHMTEHGVPK
jgi:hypothetical protein